MATQLALRETMGTGRPQAWTTARYNSQLPQEATPPACRDTQACCVTEIPNQIVRHTLPVWLRLRDMSLQLDKQANGVTTSCTMTLRSESPLAQNARRMRSTSVHERLIGPQQRLADHLARTEKPADTVGARAKLKCNPRVTLASVVLNVSNWRQDSQSPRPLEPEGYCPSGNESDDCEPNNRRIHSS